MDYTFNTSHLTCAVPVTLSGATWSNLVSAGCPQAILSLASGMNETSINSLYQKLGFFKTPNLPLPVAQAKASPDVTVLNDYILGQEGLSVTPLQMALAAAALSNQGLRPAPRLAMAIDTSQQGWVILPSTQPPSQALPASQVASATQLLSAAAAPIWESLGSAQNGPGKVVTWYIGGTLPAWKGAPIAVAVVLEENNPALAQAIGQSLIETTPTP